jgi:DNA-binding NarL/FixJ family response regulator
MCELPRGTLILMTKKAHAFFACILIAEKPELIAEGIFITLQQQPKFYLTSIIRTAPELLLHLQGHPPYRIILEARLSEITLWGIPRPIRQNHLGYPANLLSRVINPAHIFRVTLSRTNGYLLQNVSAKKLFKAIDGPFHSDCYISWSLHQHLIDQAPHSAYSIPDAKLHPNLSEKDRKVDRVIYQCHSNKNIAAQIQICSQTVESNYESFYERVRTKNMIGVLTSSIRGEIICFEKAATPEALKHNYSIFYEF